MVDRKRIATETAVARVREMEKGIVKGGFEILLQWKMVVWYNIYIGVTGREIRKKINILDLLLNVIYMPIFHILYSLYNWVINIYMLKLLTTKTFEYDKPPQIFEIG